MTNITNLLLLLPLVCAIACAPAPTEKPTPTEKPAAADGTHDQFGAGVADTTGAVPVEKALADPAAFSGKPVKLAGPITSVCQKKGCWMRIGEGDQTVFVKFKDYAFFMPLDSTGRSVVMEGELSVKEQSVEEVRHYLEDAGKHEEAKAVTEPRNVVTFMATGVAIARSK